jgi:hypothetical protein
MTCQKSRFQNLELKDEKLSLTLREPFKMIQDTSLAGKCPGMCRSQDSFRTFKEFDWGQIEQKLVYLNKALTDNNQGTGNSEHFF